MRDIDLQATEDFKCFFTRVDTGAPTDCTSIAVSIYPDNSTTQITAGVTTTQPFDSLTGFGNVRVVATVANGYAYNSTYTGAVTTGTVNSVSVVGAPLFEFTIGKNRSQLVRMGLCQASAAGTIVTDAATAFADNFLNGHVAYISAGTGAGQSRFIDTWTSATDTGTVSPNWTTTPSTDSVFQIFATPPASTGAPTPSNVTQWLGTAAATPTTAGVPEVDATHFAGQAITAAAPVTIPSSIASPTNITAGTITTATNLTNAPTNGDLTATMKASVTTAATAATPTAAAVTGAVGSVTGNVGGNVNGNVVGNVGGTVAALLGSAGIKKNAAKANFMFVMKSATTHQPQTGLVVTPTRSLDGAAFAAGTISAVTEVSGGWYRVDLGAGDLNGNTVAFRATAPGGDDTDILIVTGP